MRPRLLVQWAIDDPDLIVRTQLKSDLAEADAALRTHMASWEYAFAMGSSSDGARRHPQHVATHARTSELSIRCRDLRARLAEHEL